MASPLFGASALLSVLTAADGWLVVPEDATGLPAGAEVDVTLYLMTEQPVRPATCRPPRRPRPGSGP